MRRPYDGQRLDDDEARQIDQRNDALRRSLLLQAPTEGGEVSTDDVLEVAGDEEQTQP